MANQHLPCKQTKCEQTSLVASCVLAHGASTRLFYPQTTQERIQNDYIPTKQSMIDRWIDRRIDCMSQIQTIFCLQASIKILLTLIQYVGLGLYRYPANNLFRERSLTFSEGYCQVPMESFLNVQGTLGFGYMQPFVPLTL